MVSFSVVTDYWPEIVTRMGRLTLDSSVRECVAIRQEWKKATFSLELVVQACADEAGDNHAEVYWQKQREVWDLLHKVYVTPEFRNYREVTKDLFGLKELRRKDQSVSETTEVLP